MSKLIKINSKQKNYNIEIEYNSINKKLKKIVSQNKSTVILIDNKLSHLVDLFKKNKKIRIIYLKSGEEIKSFYYYELISKKILLKGIDRHTTIIAIGGGTIGDIGGFISSTLLRGINLVLIPTTLLAQVDSSIGGKNGINTPYGKNLIGTFYQPSLVIIDPKLLKTLPMKQIKSGYAEIIKHALINSKKFFNWLDANYINIFKLNNKYLEKAIYESILIKAKYVKNDLNEKLINEKSRSMLNFGHSFGHALETFNKYNNKLTHGEAISIGMIIESKLSYKLGNLNIDELLKIKKHFSKAGLPISDIRILNNKIFLII